MTNSTIFDIANAPFSHPSDDTVSELFGSLKKLVSGAWGSLFAAPKIGNAQLTALEESENLRAYAVQFLKSDPSFAEDLFAAADRYESADKPA